MQGKRYVISGLIFLLLAGGSIGLVGFGSASDDSSVPASLSVVAPRPGDEGVYEVTWTSAGQQSGPVIQKVGWLDPTPWMDEDGTWHPGHGFYIQGLDDGSHHSVSWGDETISWVDPPVTRVYLIENGAVEALRILDGYTSVGWLSPPSDWSGDTISITRDNTTLLATDAKVPCGFDTGLHGGRAPLNGPVSLGTGCGESMFNAKRVETIQGVQAVMFEAAASTGTFSYWFAPKIPFPVQIAWSTPYSVGEKTLVSFSQGDPVQEPVLPAPVDMAVRLAPTTWLGPSEEGLNYPYPLSQAVDEAMDMPTSGLAQWLGENPEAVAVEARADANLMMDRVERNWDVTFVSHDQAFELNVRSSWDRIHGVLEPLGLETPWIRTEFAAQGEVAPRRDTDGLLDPSELPSEAPVLVDLHRIWTASTVLPTEAFSWSWGKLTVGPGCTAAENCRGAAVAVGANARVYSPSNPLEDALGTPEQRELFFQQIVFDLEGNAIAWWEPDREYVDITVHDTWSPDHEASGFAADDSAWAFPGETVAAGSVFLGLLAAAGYLAWPWMKGLCATALFSRVRDDELLDHELRAQIHGMISANPGIHHQEMLRRIEAGKSTLDHHLNKLMEGGLVRRQKEQGYACFFLVKGTDAATMRAAPVLKAASARRIIEAVNQNPGCAANEIAARCALAPSTVSQQIQKLAAAGIVDVERGLRGRLSLYPTALGQRFAGDASST